MSKHWSKMTPAEAQALVADEARKRERMGAMLDRLQENRERADRGEPPLPDIPLEDPEPPEAPPSLIPTIRDPADLRRLSGHGWSAAAQRAFLVHLAESGSVTDACAAVGLSRQSAYRLRRGAPTSVFALGWDVAIHMARQALLDEAVERALAGREVPVWYHGEQVGTRIVHNDRLLMQLLTMRREPLHPALDPRELTHLFPAMLKMVDLVLPPGFSPERVAELTGARHDGGKE